jgi:hypothetical protein
MATKKETTVEAPIALTVDTVTGETTETILTPVELVEIHALFAEMNLPPAS